MRDDYPFAAAGFPDIEAEDPLLCPNCDMPIDARFWGQGLITFMNRAEVKTIEIMAVCADCKHAVRVRDLMDYQQQWQHELEQERELDI